MADLSSCKSSMQIFSQAVDVDAGERGWMILTD
jgi:hypothetical protein